MRKLGEQWNSESTSNPQKLIPQEKYNHRNAAIPPPKTP